MSKSTIPEVPVTMTATAGQSSWIELMKHIGLLPPHAAELRIPNTLEEGLMAVNNQGYYAGPLRQIVDRVPIPNNLPVWTQQMSELAQQKIAWYYADAQAKGIQVQEVKAPIYDPMNPMGANPIDVERYLRWEQMVDMQRRFPVYEARMQHIPVKDGESVQTQQPKTLFQKMSSLYDDVKERITMTNQNNQNVQAQMQQFAQQAAQQQQQIPVQQTMAGQIPVQQQVQPQVQQFAQQAATGQIPVQQAQPAAPQVQLTPEMMMQMMQQMGLNPQQQNGMLNSIKVWMYEHPKLTMAGCAAGGVLVFVGGKWVWKKTFGGDPEFDAHDTEVLGEIGSVFGGLLGENNQF